jgi:flagellin-like protein
MRTLMGKRFSNRGVSVIIAALLLIAIAVAAAVLLYVFSIGLMGSLSSSGGSQTKDQLVMAAYNWGSTNTLDLYLQNVGSSTLDLVPGTGTSASGPSYFVSGILVKAVPGTPACTTAQAPGTAACEMVLTNLPTVTTGASYAIKVITPDGGVFSYAAIAGQSN